MSSQLQIKLKLSTESRFDKNKVDGLPRIGQYAVEKIRQQIINHKMTATGRTQRAISYRVDGEKELRIIAESGDRAPISTLQYGREPGKFPPISKIKEWIEARRMTIKAIMYKRKPSINWQPKYTEQERGLNSAAFMIARKISKLGTDRHIQNDVTVYSPVLNEVIELFTNFIASKTEKTIVTQLLK